MNKRDWNRKNEILEQLFKLPSRLRTGQPIKHRVENEYLREVIRTVKDALMYGFIPPDEDPEATLFYKDAIEDLKKALQGMEGL